MIVTCDSFFVQPVQKKLKLASFPGRSCLSLVPRHKSFARAPGHVRRAREKFGGDYSCLNLFGHTVDREIFALKIIRVKIFRVDKFSRFRSIREIFFNG